MRRLEGVGRGGGTGVWTERLAGACAQGGGGEGRGRRRGEAGRRSFGFKSSRQGVFRKRWQRKGKEEREWGEGWRCRKRNRNRGPTKRRPTSKHMFNAMIAHQNTAERDPNSNNAPLLEG